MRVGKIYVGTVVSVGSGVNVLRRVGVKGAVAVSVGMAACVFADAALAVCAIKVLMAFASSGGSGVTMAGTHAITSTSNVNQIKSFFRGSIIEIRTTPL